MNSYITLSYVITKVTHIYLLASSLGLVASQNDCKSRINHHRTKYGVDLITEREDLHNCANRQSQYDKQMGAHKSYKRCGGLGSQGSGGGSSCGSVIDAFFNERWHCTDTTVFGSPIAESDESTLRNCQRACMDDEFCLSFDFDSDATKTCRFYDNASLTHATYAIGGSSSFWLGAPEYTNTDAGMIVDGWESFSLIEVDGSNSVPDDGQITGFKWYGANSNGVTFFIYRFVSDTTYEVVGKLQASSSSVGAENSLTANPPLEVLKGDVIGWTFEGAPAFGFKKNTKEGQVLYRNKENSGGPNDVGDQWNFDGGPTGRRYHFAASYVPNTFFPTPDVRTYCGAALCQGHCGPVMHGGTTQFAWGEWNNFYTLNWRPSARLPSGGNECPSGIEAVRCWDDDSTGILWAYGVGGEDCHSTCSLAGASPADYMCDEDSPITGGFDEVSNLMSNFENTFNANDPDEFTCTTGNCWKGESSRQIMIHENNSNCYTPTNTGKYTCDSKFGNANCFGQRFNQVCPCKKGCSWAAGPSCSPSSTNSPTISPVASTPAPIASTSVPSAFASASPSLSASASPTTSSSTSPSLATLAPVACTDKAGTWKNGNGVEKNWCRWARKNGTEQISARCAKKAVNGNCPKTCGDCTGTPSPVTSPPSSCTDKAGTWENGNGVEKNWCRWARKNGTEQISARCAKKVVNGNCPKTCGDCA